MGNTPVTRVVFCAMLIAIAASCFAQGSAPGRSNGQMVYIPLYSHIYTGDRETPFNLAATVIIRNTDPKCSIIVFHADFYDSDGKLVHRFLDSPVRISPLASTRFIVPESDTKGGLGASVLVSWRSVFPANPPIMESIMIGTRNQQGISFTSRGQVLTPSTPTASATSSHP